jgi:hypothetical protein
MEDTIIQKAGETPKIKKKKTKKDKKGSTYRKEFSIKPDKKGGKKKRSGS